MLRPIILVRVPTQHGWWTAWPITPASCSGQSRLMHDPTHYACSVFRPIATEVQSGQSSLLRASTDHACFMLGPTAPCFTLGLTTPPTIKLDVIHRYRCPGRLHPFLTVAAKGEKYPRTSPFCTGSTAGKKRVSIRYPRRSRFFRSCAYPTYTPDVGGQSGFTPHHTIHL